MAKLSFLVLFLSLLTVFSAHATVPLAINYQGYLTDSDNKPISSQITITINLYDALDAPSTKWSETLLVTPVGGKYSVVLGATRTNPIPASLFNTLMWIAIQVGTDEEMNPRQPLSSAPYAIRAASAEKIDHLCKQGDFVNCYNGTPFSTKGVGECKAGIRTCLWTLSGSVYDATCQDEVLPETESCDGTQPGPQKPAGNHRT